MGLNIKNERTTGLVRELAERSGLSQTSAVEEAVRAKLAELQAAASRDARRAKVMKLLDELHPTAEQKRAIRADEAQLYDDNGLPR